MGFRGGARTTMFFFTKKRKTINEERAKKKGKDNLGKTKRNKHKEESVIAESAREVPGRGWAN